MEDFVSSLQSGLLKATGHESSWGEINPLVIIGLAESVLDSGVSEDGLYRAIRAYSRHIAASVSPDRTKTVAKERLDQIMLAFNYLDDRQNFTKALSDFRVLRAEDRKELRVLRETIKSLRHQISAFESVSEKISQQRRELDEEVRRYQIEKQKEPLLVPSLRIENDDLLKKCSELTREAERANNKAFEWECKVSDPYSYIAWLGANDLSVQGSFIFDAKWVVLMTIESTKRYPSYIPLIDNKLNFSKEFMRHALTLGIKRETLAQIRNRWSMAVSSIGQPNNYESKETFPAISFLQLNAGIPDVKFGAQSFRKKERFVGSVPESQIDLSRSRMLYNMNRDSVVGKMTPFVSPGDVLVSISMANYVQKSKWKLTCPAFRFFTTRLVLGIG